MDFSITRVPDHQSLFSDSTDLAYVSGSRLEGFGNARSDYDLFVIYSEQLERAKGGPRQFILEDNTRVDMERYTWEQMEALAARINRQDANDAAGVYAIATDDIDLYYRTAIGAGVVNPERFAHLQKQFSREQGTQIYGTWARLRAGSFLGEAHSALAAGNRTGAYLLARRALIAAVEVRSAKLGEGYPNEKWSFDKLARHHPPGSPEYTRAWSLRTLGDQPVDRYLHNVTQYCREAGVAPVALPPWQNRVVRRGVRTRLFRVAAKHYLIHHKTFAYELNETGAEIWKLIDGSRSVGEVAEAVSRSREMSGPVVFDEIAGFVSRLLELGLATDELQLVQGDQ